MRQSESSSWKVRGLGPGRSGLARSAERSAGWCGGAGFGHHQATSALPCKTASFLWSALALGSGGLGPGNLFEQSDYPCVVITCDQATANIKLLEHLHARLPSKCFLLPLLCAQHRNGNVVEQVTKLLGILPGSYCLAKCTSKGNFLKDLKEAVKKQLEQDSVILNEEPPGLQAESSQAKKQANGRLGLKCIPWPSAW